MNKTILIVDDDFISRLVLKKTMEKQGFNIYEAENGAQALEIVQNNDHIVLVSLDLNMPVMDGYEFLNEINKTEIKSRLRIFITSCHSRNDFVKMTKENNIDTSAVKEYFEKPFYMERFSETMLANVI